MTSPHALKKALVTLGLLLPACQSPSSSDSIEDTQDTEDTAAPPLGCRSEAQPADRDRLVLVQAPYGQDALASKTWHALLLTQTGDLSTLDRPFELGRAPKGNVVFTPDASMAFVAQDDGSIGIVSINPDNTLTVQDTGFSGDFYASSLTMDPSGEILWIVDPNWPENGGGIYSAQIDCSLDQLAVPERIFSSKNASKIILLPIEETDVREALVVGREAAGTSPLSEIVRVDLFHPDINPLGSDVFRDEDAIVSDAIRFPGSNYALVADYAAFSSEPNRVAVVEYSTDSLNTIQLIEPLLDPVALIASAWEDQVLLLSGYGDALLSFHFTGRSDAPFEEGPAPSYSNGGPQLPTAVDQVMKGPLKGRVLVTENEGIRQLQFGENTSLSEVGFVAIGESFEGITGALGIAP